MLYIPLAEAPQTKERVAVTPSTDVAPLRLLALSGAVIVIGFVAAIYDPWNMEELDDTQHPADLPGIEPTQPRHQVAHVEAVGPSPIIHTNDDRKRSRCLPVVLSAFSYSQRNEDDDTSYVYNREGISFADPDWEGPGGSDLCCLESGANICGESPVVSRSWSRSREFSEAVFKANNAKRKPNAIDLHGLSVSDALRYSSSAIEDARKRGSKQIRFIVGKGLHATDGVAKIKPALQGLLLKRGIRNEIDPRNDGVLVAYLN